MLFREYIFSGAHQRKAGDIIKSIFTLEAYRRNPDIKLSPLQPTISGREIFLKQNFKKKI